MEKKKQILVILPPGPIVQEFTDMLAQAFTIIYTDNEPEGIRLLKEQHNDITAVLQDLDLARQSDFALMREVAFNKLYASIPIIAVAPRPPLPEDMDCLEKGFSELITPPCQWQLVAKRINNAVRAKDSLTFTEIEKMLKQLPSNIFLKDTEGRYVFATHYWRHVNHNDPDWTIRGKTDIDIRKDKHNAKIAMDADKKILSTGQGTEYVIEENYDGVQEFLQLIKRATFDEDGNISGIIALINDVTKQRLLEMELEKRSKTDLLTGLQNKVATEELIRLMLSPHYLKEGTTCALLMIDVDKFKTINDTLGHVKGDRVLAAIGQIIKSSFKGMDVAGRIGGDEFMVFLRDIEKADNALLLAERIERQTKQLILHEEIRAFVSVSIGISMFPEHGKTFEELYSAADKALYYVKKHGRANWKLYTPELENE